MRTLTVKPRAAMRHLSWQKSALIWDLIDYLNSVRELDPEWLRLIQEPATCNEAVASDPFIQVARVSYSDNPKGYFVSGLVGLLNGFIGSGLDTGFIIRDAKSGNFAFMKGDTLYE